MATGFALPGSPTVGQVETLPGGEQVEWDGHSWVPLGGGGGGNNLTINDDPPLSPGFGDRWLSPATGEEAIWVNTVDGVGAWYVPAGPIGIDFDPTDYLKNTTDTFTGTLTMAGSVIPAADVTYDLGSPTHMWRDLFVGPGSIYMNGKKILEDSSDTIVFSTDINQNVRMETDGTGNIEIKSNDAGSILIQGTMNIAAGKKFISSNGDKIEFGDDLDVGVNKVTSSAIPSGATHLTNKLYVDGVTVNDTTIVRTTGDQTVGGNKTMSGNLVVGGNLTVQGTTTTVNSETVAIADNILELNSNFTVGSPTENSGILVRRGDLGTVQWIWDEANDRFTGISGAGVVQNIYVGEITAATYNGLTKSSVGLSNVDNTSDANKPVSTATGTALAGKLNLTGGALTGALQIAPASGSSVFYLDKVSGASNSSSIQGRIGTSPRWQMDLGNASAASDFALHRFNDSGAYLDGPIQVSRSTGMVQLGNVTATGTLQVNSTINSSSGISGGSLYSSGNISAAGNITTGNTVQGGYVASSGNGYCAGSFSTGGTINAGTGMTFSGNSSISIQGYQAFGDRSHIYHTLANPNYTQMTFECIHFHGQFVTWRFYVNGQSFDHRHDGWGEAPSGWRTPSDIRLKSEIQRIDNAWDKIDLINGYTYLKEGGFDNIKNVHPREAGLIAQECEAAIPEAVADGGNGFKTLHINGVVALHTEMLKTLKLKHIEEVTSLKQRVTFLEDTLQDVLARLAKLEG